MRNLAIILLILGVSNIDAQWIEPGGVSSLSEYSGIYSVCSDKAGNIYATGYFTSTPSALYISKWDGQSWSKIQGLNGNFASIVCSDGSGDLYAIIYTSLYEVVKWDGASWAYLGNPLAGQNLTVDKLCADSSGNLYAAGQYANGSPYVARWNSGSNWIVLGSFTGLTSYKQISSICADKTGNIYATGGFTNAAGNYYVAKWDGSNWAEVGGLNAFAPNNGIMSIHCDFNNNLFAGGFFTNSNGNFFVAKWDGIKWLQEVEFASVFQNSNTGILDLCSDDAGNLYIGGALFLKISLEPLVLKWNGSSLQELSGGQASHTGFISMCTDLAGNLYAAGTYKNGFEDNVVAMYPNAKYVGIKEQQAENNNIKIFPNPAVDKITVQLKGVAKNAQAFIRIKDVLGKVLYEGNFVQRGSVIDVSGFPPGLYLVSVTANGRSTTGKIVME
jgi:hypothetical protein